MIVVDTSALVDGLLPHGPLTAIVRSRIAEDAMWHAPEHMVVEVVSSVRGRRLGRQISEAQASRALDDFRAMAITLHTVRPLIDRIWELKDNLTPYDAAYVALAETLRCPLITCDARIAQAPDIRCTVEVMRV